MAGQEVLTTDGPHRVEHGWIGHALWAQLILDHGFTGGCKIGDRALNRHDCYMPIIHLKIKLALIGSGGPSQPPFIETLMRPAGVDRQRTRPPKRLLSPARWRSGYAEDCKSLHAGSIPARASIPQVQN